MIYKETHEIFGNSLSHKYHSIFFKNKKSGNDSDNIFFNRFPLNKRSFFIHKINVIVVNANL